MESPFEFLKKSASENVEFTKQNNKFIFEQTDKIITWLIGFSFAALSLIVVNYCDIANIIGILMLKLTILCFGLTIILGIIYRISGFYLQLILAKIQIFLSSAFSNKRIMNIRDSQLKDENDIKYIIKKIKDDFGEDHSHLVNMYDTLVLPQHKLDLVESIRKHYYKLKDWAIHDYELGIEFIKEIYKTAFGYNDKQVNKLTTSVTENHFWYKFLSIMWKVSFTSACAIFTLSLILIVALIFLN